MDIERYTHSGYRLSVLISIVLSGLVVTLVAFLGRGALNLKGELLGDGTGKPTDATVIVLVLPKLAEDVTIIGIDFLREEKKSYAYQVKTSDGSFYLVKIGFDDEQKKWALTEYELLHGE